MKNLCNLMILFLIGIMFSSCETSEGIKAGVLQKVSHKKFPCNYYVAEFAFDGGRMVGSDDSKGYENTQSVEITKEAFDSLSLYVGNRVRFDYSDKGMTMCGENKKLTSITVIK